jgi:hypothetical protein
MCCEKKSVEEEMDHLLIRRPVFDEMGFVASQHLDSVRDKFHLHDLSHIGEELLEKDNQLSGALSKLLLKPADIPESDLPDVLPPAKGQKIKKQEQIMPSVLDKDQYELQWVEIDDGVHVVLQPDIKFASLKEQSLFYGDIPDGEPIDCHDVEAGKRSPEELADAIEGLVASAEQAGMSRNGVQSLRLLTTECKSVFRHKWRRPSCECEASSRQAARRCRTRANVVIDILSRDNKSEGL